VDIPEEEEEKVPEGRYDNATHQEILPIPGGVINSELDPERITTHGSVNVTEENARSQPLDATQRFTEFRLDSCRLDRLPAYSQPMELRRQACEKLMRQKRDYACVPVVIQRAPEERELAKLQ
jgi:hypothetical protein